MKHNYKDLLRQLAALSEDFSHLGTRLSQAIRELQDSGMPPSEGLAEELAASHKGFVDLRGRVLELAESFVISPLPKLDEIVSLRALKSLLQAVEKVEEKRGAGEKVRQHALMILARILAITHRDNIDFPPLVECQATARELRQSILESQWPHLHQDTNALAEGTHPFSQLLILVEQQADLDDDHWVLLQDAVAQSVGKSLSVAASRGKLIVLEESIPEISPFPAVKDDKSPSLAEHIEPVAAPGSDQPMEQTTSQAFSEEMATQEGDVALTTAMGEDVTEESEVSPKHSMARQPSIEEAVGSSQETAHGEIQAVQDKTLVEATHPPKKLEMQEDPVTHAQPLFEVEAKHDTHAEDQMEEESEKEQPLSRFPLDDTAQKIAGSILASTTEEHPAALRDLLWRLIFEDEVGLAFHIARCLEIQYPDLQPRLPSWLVRSVVLGRYVCHATGDIARLLKEDFNKFNNDCFATGKSEWNHAVRFLLAAAALRPALLAPNTNASTILYELRMKEGLARLYECCQIIANYGAKLQALDPNALKKVKDQAVWQADLDSLQQEVESWCSQAPRMTIVYAPATKVWRKWQEPHGLIHSLLLPVRQNDLNGLQDAKQAVERFSDDVQIKREVDHTDRKVLGRRLGDDIIAKALGQIRMHVHEAVGFVRRWIVLHEFRPGQSKGYLQKQAEQLRQEIWDCREAVLSDSR